MEKLPPEVFLEIVSYLDLKCIGLSASVSRGWYKLLSTDRVWKDLFRRMELDIYGKKLLKEAEKQIEWKQLVKNQVEWIWDIASVPSSLAVYHSRHSIKRIQPVTTNPSLRTTRELTPNRNFFEVTLKRLGSWVSVGIATEFFPSEGGAVVGSSNDYFNSGWYTDDSSFSIDYFVPELHTIYQKWNSHSKLVTGDRIGVMIDFQNFTVSYFKNDQPIALIPVTNLSFNNSIYPTVSVGFKTKISFNVNFRKPTKTE